MFWIALVISANSVVPRTMSCNVARDGRSIMWYLILPSMLRSGQQKKDRATLVREKKIREDMVTFHKTRTETTIHPERCCMMERKSTR